MVAIEVGDVTIAFRRQGEGPALLLVHGFVVDAAATWAAQLAGLSDAYTVVACDLPGSGGVFLPGVGHASNVEDPAASTAR